VSDFLKYGGGERIRGRKNLPLEIVKNHLFHVTKKDMRLFLDSFVIELRAEKRTNTVRVLLRETTRYVYLPTPPKYDDELPLAREVRLFF